MTIESREREEVHRAIWAIADNLRGAVDGWDFKNYVLGTIFYRYISERITNYINNNQKAAGIENFNYADMKDSDAEAARETLINEQGFFILPSELFCNIKDSAKSDPNLNMTLERVFKNIENSAKGADDENKFAGLFDDFDVNSNQLGGNVDIRNERLKKLLDGVADMNLDSERNIDALGDAYEYLMSMYASNAGKSGGEFFTPADVSELLTRLGTVGKTSVSKIYDPACGSGSLLLKIRKILGDDSVGEFYGQEINVTTYNLCRINMFLHGISFDRFDIKCGDTLIHPEHWDAQPFDLIVSNPPYAVKWKGSEDAKLINDPRYSPAGVLAPKSNSDFAFVMHSLYFLDVNGTAAIVCFPGIMYRAGAEQKIREYLVENNYIDAVIQLPEKLFFGTGIATCILVMKKNKTDSKILFMDAGNEFVKSINNNRLTSENISRIVDAYTKREDIEAFCKIVPNEEVKEMDYNLSVTTYVSPGNLREKINIEELNCEINEIVAHENALRLEIDRIIQEISKYARR